MIELIRNHIIPASMSLLHPAMRSDKSMAMLLSIAMQESRGIYRKQVNGPAKGFWQFEEAGIRGVRTHKASEKHYLRLLTDLSYKPTLTDYEVHKIIEHNDILACGIARLLLWTLPVGLPGPDDHTSSWGQYLAAWRPGKPHVETWNTFYNYAWEITNDANKISRA